MVDEYCYIVNLAVYLYIFRLTCFVSEDSHFYNHIFGCKPVQDKSIEAWGLSRDSVGIHAHIFFNDVINSYEPIVS